jgi:hypothetical protein
MKIGSDSKITLRRVFGTSPYREQSSCESSSLILQYVLGIHWTEIDLKTNGQ